MNISGSVQTSSEASLKTNGGFLTPRKALVRWETFTQAKFLHRYEVFLTSEEAAIPERAWQWEHETRGGECWYCRKPWKLIIVKEVARFGDEEKVMADYQFYEPGCKCFKRCMTVQVEKEIQAKKEVKKIVLGKRAGCGHWLIEEKLRGLERCMNCGAKIAGGGKHE